MENILNQTKEQRAETIKKLSKLPNRFSIIPIGDIPYLAKDGVPIYPISNDDVNDFITLIAKATTYDQLMNIETQDI